MILRWTKAENNSKTSGTSQMTRKLITKKKENLLLGGDKAGFNAVDADQSVQTLTRGYPQRLRRQSVHTGKRKQTVTKTYRP